VKNVYNGKKLVIIGAGLLQIPLIKIAKKLGIYTIITDGSKDAEGFKYADK